MEGGRERMRHDVVFLLYFLVSIRAIPFVDVNDAKCKNMMIELINKCT